MKQFLFGPRCSMTFCFRKIWGFMQISAGSHVERVPYCRKHALIADKLFQEKAIKSKIPIDYEPMPRGKDANPKLYG